MAVTLGALFDPTSWPDFAQFLQQVDTLAQPAAAAAALQEYPYFGRIWNWSSSICAFWPGKDADRYTGPFNRRTANPVLVIGNRSDPATRYQDAVSTARTLPRSSLITVEGWGHTSLSYRPVWTVTSAGTCSPGRYRAGTPCAAWTSSRSRA